MHHSEQEAVNRVQSRKITSTKMFKTAVSAVKVMPTILWDVKHVEYSELMPTGKTINILLTVKQYGSRKHDFEECVLT